MKKNLLSVALAAVLGLASASALAETWAVDSSHSTVGFSVRHMMVSNVKGAFGKFTATVDGSPADPATAKISATIEVASVDTRDTKRDDHLRSADFFDAAKFPQMTFTSTKVEKLSATAAKVTGDLTFHGVTKPVVLDVEYTQPVKSPWGKSVVGATATGKISRKDFGVAWSKTLDGGGLVVGDEVTLQFDLELVKKDAPVKDASAK
ncbi:MAG: polyisoprenoid-binding protein [Holophagales bacterium]|nr:polyisoprenoid-binding protein [Holophagales bacterium]